MILDTATISVLVSGCVAIAGIMIAPLVGLVADWIKWRRGRQETEAGRIHQTTVELLDMLAGFQSLRSETAPQGHEPTLRNLLSKYYAWEIAILLYCKKADRNKLKELRGRFENENIKDPEAGAEAYEKMRTAFYREGASLARDISALANSTREKLS